MRTQALCLALAIVLLCPYASAQWVRQESGATKNLYGVYFTDASTGTVVGDSGTILRTTNGGATWTTQSAGTRLRLTDIQFIGRHSGWAVGDSGIVIHTADGGASWSRLGNGTTDNLQSISFADVMAGWVVGGGTILRTTNGGDNWTSLNVNAGVYLRSVYSVNRDTVFAVGDSSSVPSSHSDGIILKTTNGGMSWDRYVPVGSSPNSQTTGLESPRSCLAAIHYYYRRVQFTDDLRGWILCFYTVFLADNGGCCSYVLNTTDAGVTWSEKPAIGEVEFTSSYFVDSSTGWAVSAAGGWNDTTAIWLTTDGGSTWNTQFVENLGYYGWRLEDICFVDNTNGWAVGGSGTILHTTNGGVTWVEGQQDGVPQQFVLSQNYPNPFNPSTTIRYALPRSSVVRSSVDDILGREVSALVNERKNAGPYEAKFDATGLANGVYLYRLQAGDFISVKRCLLLR